MEEPKTQVQSKILNLKLKQFNLSFVKPGSCVVIVGKKDTNKNVLVNQLLCKNIQNYVIVSSPEQYNYSAICTQTEFIFIHSEHNINIRRKLYEQWGNIVPDFDTFCQILNQCTTDNECLVVDNTTTSKNIEDHFYWYRPL